MTELGLLNDNAKTQYYLWAERTRPEKTKTGWESLIRLDGTIAHFIQVFQVVKCVSSKLLHELILNMCRTRYPCLPTHKPPPPLFEDRIDSQSIQMWGRFYWKTQLKKVSVISLIVHNAMKSSTSPSVVAAQLEHHLLNLRLSSLKLSPALSLSLSLSLFLNEMQKALSTQNQFTIAPW